MAASRSEGPEGPEGAKNSFPRAFGKYTLTRHLAIGGMADVFVAHQKGPAGFEKECVIKRILPNLAVDAEFVQMFLDEARIAARLSHPNIVQLFDLGQVGKDYFLAMEFVDGVNLEHVMERLHALAKASGGTRAPVVPWPLAVRITAEVAAGLDHAHNSRDSAGRSLGLVHRDISPSNVMVGWGGAAKILDFGIAKAVEGNIKRAKTEVGTVKGKVPYMSPEQLQGLALDGRSDLFSLGGILYELTCGSRPFPAETAGLLTMQILHEDPRSPDQVPGMSSSGTEYPPALWAIVKKALAKPQAQRFQTARDFKRALEQLLAAEHASCTAYDVEAYLRELFPEESQRTAMTPSSQVSGIGPTEGRVPASGPLPAGAAPAKVVDRPPVEMAHSGGAAQDAKDAKEKERAMDGEDKRARAHATRLPTGAEEGEGPSARLEVPAAELDDLLAAEGRPRRRGGGGVVMMAIVALVLGTAVTLFALRRHVLQEEAQQQAPPPATPVTPAPSPPAAPAPVAVAKPAEPAAVKPVAEPLKTPEVPVKKPEPARRPEPVRRPHHPAAERPEKKDDEPVRLPRLPTPPPAEPE